MNEDFLTRAENKRNEYLLKTEELFVANKDRWFADFADHFLDICTQIKKCQSESALPPISYLEYTMLYTNFINRHYVADIFIYGDKSYLDRDQRFIGNYDISFLFGYFDQLWDDIISLKRRYPGLVSAQEITPFVMGTLPDFYSYLANIARFAIGECVDKSPFADINKNEDFMVNIGDYMAKTEPVYRAKKNKDANKLAKWFNEQLLSKYIFDDYSGLDFTGKSFLYTDFRYSRFQNSTLNKINLEGSSLIGANFRNALMEECRLDNCSINEADFSGASLKQTSFKNAWAKTGLTDENKWRFVGFLPVIFRNADLTGVDFSGANLTGADFSGARLTGASFSGAVTDGAIFDGSSGWKG
jgi:uncharacterized protein YjbI with pentapeptide repeats